MARQLSQSYILVTSFWGVFFAEFIKLEGEFFARRQLPLRRVQYRKTESIIACWEMANKLNLNY
jgi:hypothetical protein